VVYGIVKAHHGSSIWKVNPEWEVHLFLFSLTTFDKKNTLSLQLKTSDDRSGSETILVVEDEKSLLDLAQLIFESKGYTVLAAKDGIEAVEMFKQHKEKISLVFTDMDCRTHGREVFTKLKE